MGSRLHWGNVEGGVFDLVLTLDGRQVSVQFDSLCAYMRGHRIAMQESQLSRDCRAELLDSWPWLTAIVRKSGRGARLAPRAWMEEAWSRM